MAKSKPAKKASFDIQAWLGIVILVLLSAYFLRTCTRWHQEAAALSQGVFTTKAVVINKKNYLGNSPVSRQFAYSYQFTLEGKNYEGDSHNPALHVGDSILVDYAMRRKTRLTIECIPSELVRACYQALAIDPSRRACHII